MSASASVWQAIEAYRERRKVEPYDVDAALVVIRKILADVDPSEPLLALLWTENQAEPAQPPDVEELVARLQAIRVQSASQEDRG